jgi:hypothetical protein
MNKTYLFLVFIITLSVSCKNQVVEKVVSQAEVSSPENLIADTIIYDVIIKNPNPNDEWTEECLQHFNRPNFVNDIFQAVYNKEVEAFDYFNDELLKPNKLQKMEEDGEVDRDLIGKIQFTEKWYYDKNNLIFSKEILSVVLGEEIHNQDGGIRGYKPIFRVELN